MFIGWKLQFIFSLFGFRVKKKMNLKWKFQVELWYQLCTQVDLVKSSGDFEDGLCGSHRSGYTFLQFF